MAFRPKVKNFIQNTLFFSLGLLITASLYERGYGVYSGETPVEDRGQIRTIGTTATALGMNLGLRAHIADTGPVHLAPDALEVGAVIADPKVQKNNFLTSHMKYLSEYTNLLGTDIPALLDRSIDRTQTLDDHIALLTRTQSESIDRIAVLERQREEYRVAIDEIVNRGKLAREATLTAYENTDTTTMQGSMEGYIESKRDETEARMYLSFIERFLSTYAKLQNANIRLTNALTLNREPLIKRATVTIPNNNTSLLRTLDLLQDEKN